MSGTRQGPAAQDRQRGTRAQQATRQSGARLGGDMAAYLLRLQRTAGNQVVGLLLRQYQVLHGADSTAKGRAQSNTAAAGTGTVFRAAPAGASTAAPAGSLLSEGKMQAALAWGANGDHIGTEAIKAVQAKLGMDSPSGVYDQDTVEKIAEWQHANHVAVDGEAGPATFAAMGLVLTRKISAAGLSSDDILKHLHQEGGATLAVYAEYRGTTSAKLKGDEAEFKSKADAHAQRFQALGLHGTDIAEGVAIPVNGAGEVIEKVQSIEMGLTDRYRQIHPHRHHIPHYLRVKNLAIYSHGLQHSMGLDPGNTHRAALGGLSETNLQAFAQGLNGALAPDVRVQLFACSTAGGGSDSLAAHLAQDLGKGASVYGHEVEGNTTDNPVAKVFGKDAGGDANPQGLSLFDMMFPEAYQTAELERLFPDDQNREARRKSLVAQMKACYIDSVEGTAIKGSGGSVTFKRLAPFAKGTPNIGDEMFTDPDNARQLLHDHWQNAWLADPAHLKAIKPDPAWKPPAPTPATPAAQ